MNSLSPLLMLAFGWGITGEVVAEPAPVITIYRHAAWHSTPPKGVEADGIRRNLGVGDSVTFKDITLTLNSMTAGSPDQVNVTLTVGEETDTRTVGEKSAFNFGDYHIAVVAAYTTQGDLGFNLTVFEIATIESLPPEIANKTTANGAADRLRVRHEINKLTLHHSATPHNPGDDLAQKLRNMQSWGENDRVWWDIPYHYMIDLDGKVFEARDHNFVGDTNTKYDPAGHFLINCFGNYSVAEPNELQLQTIANLMAWAAMEYNIEPLEIYGHKDLANTSCPGTNLYAYVADGRLEQMVKDVMAKGQPTIEYLEELPAKKVVTPP